jgi:hypothetical protein
MAGCYFIQVPDNQFVNVPLPPSQGNGVVKFGQVFLSVSHVPVPGQTSTALVDVSIFDYNGTPRINNTVSIGAGRTVVAEALPGDMVARVNTHFPNAQFNISVLVEYQ